MSTSPLRVCLDARLVSGAGGTEQFIINLASSLGRLSDGDEEYVFLCVPGQDAWIKPFIGRSSRIAYTPAADAATPSWRKRAKRLLPFAPGLLQWWRLNLGRQVPRSDGTVESLGVDLVHFTKQDAFLTSLPSIYHPHDLQHVHLPELLGATQVRQREHAYRLFCEQARTILVASEWVREDVLGHYDLPAEKVQIVNLAPFTAAYKEPTESELAATRELFDLPDRYILYAAQTWPHKNHIGLLEALALVRDRDGVEVPLICTGTKNEFYPEIEKRSRELGLESQARFLGFVGSQDLAAIYKLATAVVVPTKFEAASSPLWEAFAAGVPAACSTVTSLPRQAGDAALLFDPDDWQEMAIAIARLWCDNELRAELVARGRANVARYSWDTTARMFRAHYRRISGRATPEDLELLARPPLY